ncbi:winged helix-turn-helix domain-containing protein [Luteimonas arsenica]|uniref:winged helix-turn-helix domain-containing protein n=1 Tax=Luteimonas arsenica TaxID=1586242 RepID=UPI001404EBC4|nr:winged helix-turn-helix domain-containing protein [Luteimonas arsenica]
MTPRYRFGRYQLDTATRELLRDGVPVALQARVFECLLCLIEHRDRAVPRDELVEAVFRRADVSDAQLGQVMVRTRRAVGDDGQAQHTVRTVPRYGFRWVAPVEVDEDGEAALPGEVAPASMPIGPPLPPAGTLSPAAPPSRLAEPWPDGVRPSWPGKRAAIAIAALVLILLVAAAAWWSARQHLPTDAPDAAAADAGAVAGQDALLVLPTRVDGGEDVAWVRLGLMDYLGDRLRRGGLAVLSSESALAAHARGVVDRPELFRGTLGRGWLLESEAVREGASWRVRLAARDGGGVVHAATGAADDLLEAARLAADRLAPRLGGTAPDGTDAPGLAERLQRARAAMLADEIDAARAILLAAPELQRAQPRLQYQLARVDFRAGDHERGLARLDRLLDADAASEPVFRAQVLNARGAMLVRLERLDEAEATYDAAAAEAAEHPAELGQALSGRAVVHAMNGRFDPALADFGRARVALQRTGDALAVARIDANLGILEADRGRPAQALPFLDEAEQAFSAMGAVNELATVLVARTGAELRLLRVGQALAAGERALALRDRVADPAQAAALVQARSGALRLAGRLEEAAALAEVRGPPGPGLTPRLEAAVGDAALALARDRPDEALAVADRALAEVPAGVQPEARAWLLLRREQAALRLDRPLRAAADADLGTFVPDRLRRALRLRQAGRPAAEVDAAFADALSLAEREGVPADIAEVVLAYADWLLREGRQAEAAALAGRVAVWSPAVPALAGLQARVAAAADGDHESDASD